MKKHGISRGWVSAAVVTAALGFSTSANAAFISGLVNIDFNKAGSSVGTAGGAAVVGAAGDTWNGIAVAVSPGPASGTNISLVDSTNAASDATLSYSADYGLDVGSSSFFPALLKDYLRVQNAAGTVTIGGLSSAVTYDVYLYIASDTQNRVSTFTVDGATSSTAANSSDQTLTSFVEGKNYLKFTLSPDANDQIKITIHQGGGATQGNLNGLQIQAVPEPASLAILGLLGGFMTLGRSHRRMVSR